MDKYKKTAGLNYLSENSYKGDGAPGMVMGIASDARGDTNTYENKKPTTSSKHSNERDLKQYDPAHGHTKPEGGKPGVCSCITSSGPSTDCAKCGGTGEIITPKRKDQKVDESDVGTTKRIKAMSSADLANVIGKQPLWVYFNRDKAEEMAMNHRDQFMSKLDHPEFMEDGQTIKGMAADLGKEGKASKADLAKTKEHLAKFPHLKNQISVKEEDDELNEITKLSGLGEAKPKRKPRHDDFDDDDFDTPEDAPEDPDKEKVQHILMQLRKAQDVDGDHPIKFLDGTSVKLPLADIGLFMNKYMDMKPLDREKMQQVAIMSKDKFDTILSFFQPQHSKPEKSIY